MFEDPFQNFANSLVAPAEHCFAITPDDDADLISGTKALFVGTGGDVTLRAVASDADVVFRNLPDGSIIDVRVQAVRATGTSAADIVGLV